MPYSDPEKQREAVRQAVQRHRGITETQVIPDPCNTPDVIPDNQGVDGWHTTDKGMRYILQDTGLGGYARRYSPGPRMFSYR